MSSIATSRPWPERRPTFVTLSAISWALTAATLAFVTLVVLIAGIEVRLLPMPINALICAVFGIVGLFYTYVRSDPGVAAFCDAVALLSAFTLIGGVYTYVTTYLGGGQPLWDARFAAADAAIGFDWRLWLERLKAYPTLAQVLDLAYRSILPQAGALIAVLALSRRHRDLQTFILAAQLSILVCGACAGLMPALGVYEHLGITAADHAGIPLATVDRHVPHVEAMWGPSPAIQLNRIEGIVVFPSFHTTVAILFTWAVWRVPVVRWLALGINGLMVAGTPLSGGHYLVDILAGALLAIAAIAAARRLVKGLDARTAGEAARPRTAAAEAF